MLIQTNSQNIFHLKCLDIIIHPFRNEATEYDDDDKNDNNNKDNYYNDDEGKK
jgi:hypothetical protein